ncbi:hypothetical protein ACFL00_03090 [Pseudomonadota bacterium]
MKVWKIEGWHSTTKIYERELKLGYFSDNQMETLLRTIAAKDGLKFDEIIGAYARRRTKIANDLLVVHSDRKFHSYTCGDNPYFTARVVDSDCKS